MRPVLHTLLLISIFSACQRVSDDLISFDGLTMGTSYSVKLISSEIPVNKQKIQTDIEEILAEINQAMSTYIADSELSTLNQSNSNEWQTVSADLYHVIEQANKISVISNGAFDITVGPLVNLWGFGPDPFTQIIPEQALLASVKQHTGYEKLQLDNARKSILKTVPDIYVDLSAIAKGFAVDKIAAYLDNNKIEHYLVEIGGELIAKGLNSNGIPWQVGIEQPEAFQQSIQQVISLNNIAMATSGDYRNYFE